MREDVVEQPLLVGVVVPPDRLVEHHEEEAVERLREQELEEVVGAHGQGFRWLDCHKLEALGYGGMAVW